MVAVGQLVRASDCGSECRGFESHQPPQSLANCKTFFYLPCTTLRQKLNGAHFHVLHFLLYTVLIYSAFVARRIPRRFGAAVSAGFSC